MSLLIRYLIYFILNQTGMLLVFNVSDVSLFSYDGFRLLVGFSIIMGASFMQGWDEHANA